MRSVYGGYTPRPQHEEKDDTPHGPFIFDRVSEEEFNEFRHDMECIVLFLLGLMLIVLAATLIGAVGIVFVQFIGRLFGF